VSLPEPKERIHFRSKVEAMGQSVDRQRDFDAFVVPAKGEGTAKHAKVVSGSCFRVFGVFGG
jgi:hypothetical protein